MCVGGCINLFTWDWVKSALSMSVPRYILLGVGFGRA